MKKEIIINSAINETRVAITEDGDLAEFFIELPNKERYVGNIYFGRVNRIVTGINAAFIDIGLNQDAFLHFSDVEDNTESTFITEEDDDEELVIENEDISEKIEIPINDENTDLTESNDELDDFDNDEEFENVEVQYTEPALLEIPLHLNQENPYEQDKPQEQDKIQEQDKPQEQKQSTSRKKENSAQSKTDDTNIENTTVFKTKRSGDIQINLIEGQNVIVQVTREAYANKGVKVTTKIALPGRYVVLLPYDNMLGVSRKIIAYPERRRLRALAKSFLPKGAGCIIRTASKGKIEEELKQDWEELIDVWNDIDQKVKKAVKPSIVYQDMQLANSVIRDLFTTNVQKVVLDSKKLYNETVNYLKRVSPHLESRVELYTGNKSIFEEYGVEKELAKTYKRRVNLYSGGDIVIDGTEAMTVVDVNSGKTYEREQERNAFRTNYEAAHEIAKQIRLRDLAGMILIDFIDMGEDSNKRKLFHEMKKELLKDRAKTVVYPLTQLSIMQITRQRINQNIVEKITDNCPMCKGTGRVTSKTVLLSEIERWLKNFRKNTSEFRIELIVHPNIAEFITQGTISTISKLMIKYFVKIKLQQSDSIQIDQFKFFSVRQQKEITSEYL
jgi:ribonuclease G